MNNKPIIEQNSDSHELLDLISVDLPSFEEFQLSPYITPTILAKLTGAISYSNLSVDRYRCYLRDFEEGDKHNISFVLSDIPRVLTNYTDNHGEDIYKTEKFSRNYIIRPVLRFDKCPELFDLIVSQLSYVYKYSEDQVKQLFLGEFPQNVLPPGYQKDLKTLFLTGRLKKTKDSVILDKVKPFNKKSETKDFVPQKYPIYEYDNERYIRFPIRYLEGDYWKGLKHYTNFLITDAGAYHVGDVIWLKVSDVKFHVGDKFLIANQGLLSGIAFENYSHGKDDTIIDYETSNIKKYLNLYMKPLLLKNLIAQLRKAIEEANKYKKLINSGDTIRDISLRLRVSSEDIKRRLEVFNFSEELIDAIMGKEKKSKKVFPPKTQNKSVNNKSKEILAIREEIKKFAKYSMTDESALEEADQLIKDYNNSVLTYDELELSLEPKSGKPENLYIKLKLDLESLLERLKENSIHIRGYFEMIEILEECQKETIDEDYDEICSSIKAAKAIINGLVNIERKNQLNNDLDSLINKYIILCKEGIEEYRTSHTVETKKLDDLKFMFNKELRNILFDIQKAINEQDVVSAIIEKVNDTIKSQKSEAEDQRISFLVKEINNFVEEINTNGNDEEKASLKALQDSFLIDKTKDIHTVLSQYNELLRKVISINLQIQRRIERDKIIKDMLINIDDANTLDVNRK